MYVYYVQYKYFNYLGVLKIFSGAIGIDLPSLV